MANGIVTLGENYHTCDASHWKISLEIGITNGCESESCRILTLRYGIGHPAITQHIEGVGWLYDACFWKMASRQLFISTVQAPVHRGFDTLVGYYGGCIDDIPSVNSTDNYWVDLCACQTKSPSIPRGACNEYMAHPRIVCHLAMDIVNQTATGGIQVINSTNIKQESIDLFFANQVEQVILNTPFTDPLFLYLAWNTPHFPGKEQTTIPTSNNKR